jgi:hypothetical protein
MDVDDDGEFLFDCEVDDGVELFHEGYAVGLFALPGEEWVGVDAEADVIEAEMMDEADVVGSGEGAEALDGVVVGLREPVAGVDAAAEMLGALEGEVICLLGGCRGGYQ